MSDFHKNLRPALLSSPSYLGSEAIYHDFDQVAANLTKTYICQQTNMLPIIRNLRTIFTADRRYRPTNGETIRWPTEYGLWIPDSYGQTNIFPPE